VILWSTCCPLCQDSFLHVLEHVLVRELMMMMMTFICSCRNNNQAHGSAGTAAEWAGGGDGGAGAHRGGDGMVPTPRGHAPSYAAKAGETASPAFVERESVLFIGTQFSNLYTAVHTPARGRGWHMMAKQRRQLSLHMLRGQS
jgi:hypothetical protein